MLGLNMKWKKLTLILILLLFLMPACVDADWHFVSPMPHGRYGHGATLGPDGRIYVMGGMVFEVTEKKLLYKKYNDGMYSNLAYDPKKDIWKYLEPVPGWIYPRHFKIFDPDMGIWRTVRKVKGEKNYYEVFDPANKKSKWNLIPREIPLEKLRKTDVERQGDGVAVVTGKDGLIYWLGGNGKWLGDGESIVLPYDPVNAVWPKVGSKRIYYSSSAYGDKTVYETDTPSMLERRIDHKAVVTSDGKIYVMGGRREKQRKSYRGQFIGTGEIEISDTLECYDPVTNKWEYKKPMSSQRMLFASVVGPDDKIYVFGGAAGLSTEPSTPILDTTEVYDPDTDTWSSRTPIPAPREGHAGVLGADGKIYIMGGGNVFRGPPLKDVLIYDPVKDTWKKGPVMKRPRHTLAAVATPDGKIYAIGGTDVGAYENRRGMNFFLPEKLELYTGKVQNTVEVLGIFKLK